MKIPVWVAMVMAMAPAALATDRYESVLGAGFGDDTSNSYVELLHGRIRAHDLQGPTAIVADLDWSFVQETLRHSYEVTVMNTALRFSSVPLAGYATFNRCDTGGTILTPGTPLNLYDGAFAARWISTSASFTYIRVTGFAGLGPDSGYEIQLRDTTYSIPRWNNTASQVTVFLIANTKGQSVTGNVYFYSGAGTLLATVPLSVPAHGVQTLVTSAIPALASLSGSAEIAHVGGYGALSGKAVSLEPGTGFTFDTPMSPIPY